MAATDPIVEPMPEPEEAASGPRMADEPEASAHGPGGCPVTWCPICITVGAVQTMAPDVMEHLLKAGTELFLAFRAVVDARADEADGQKDEGAGGSSTLEKIDLG